MGCTSFHGPGDIGDGEELDLGELALVFGEHGRRARPVEVLRRDFLARVGVQVLEIGFRYRARAMLVDVFVDDGNRRLGQNAGGRVDDLEFVGAEFLQRQIGFVLPGEQHVA